MAYHLGDISSLTTGPVMAKKSGLKAKPPKGILWKPLQADGWGLFKSLSKAGVNLLTLDWEKAVDNALGAIECVKFKDEPGELAWAIVYRAMTRAIVALLRDPKSGLTAEQIEKARAKSAQFDTKLAAADVVINEEFFEHPGWSPYAREVSKQLREWLKAGGVEDFRADGLAWELPWYFTSELSHEWLRNKPYVEKLLPANFRTPFTPAEEEEFAWAEYAGWLQDQADRRVFEEDFGLMSVYVPLRAYVETGGRGAPLVRTVGVAEQMLDEWVKKGLSSDDIRVIEGDPGAGKSSTARVYAATRFGREIGGRRWRVVYVPLHRIDAELKLEAAVAKYGEQIRARLPRPLDKDAPDPTLLILDGLDELSKAGHVGQDVIQGFTSEVIGLRSAWNHDRDQARLLVLICGRPVAVDTIRSDVKSEQGYIYLLPYLVNQQEVGKRPHQTPVQVNDSDGLLEKDQREVWWAKYAAARKRSDGVALYERIKKRNDLTSITAQPLLNYLVAYLLQTGEGDALPDNLSQIYARLLRRVWERGWERGPQGQRLEFEPFCDLLEVIALAAWHSGDGRSVSLHRVEGTLTAAQREQLAQLEEQVSDGVLRLLLSFFFRPVGYETRENKQHRTYEFSHKSFAEYLVSRRLVRLLRELAEDWSQFGGKRHWDDEQALVRWQELFGPTQLDAAIDAFIRHEVRHVGGEVAAGWQKLVARLLGVVIERGMPMHQMGGALQPATYQEMNRQALNGEYALLGFLDACGAVADAREVIPGLVPQLASWVDSRWRVLLKRHWLDFLNLQGADLSGADLSGAYLSGADLSGADLSGAYLSGAYLSGADLSGADLPQAYLSEADLSGANLSGVDLSGADLSGADLSGAYLSGADLSGAYLSGANLSQADLSGADLSGADLSGADLSGADLSGVSYTEDQVLTTWGTPARLADGTVPAPNFREKLGKPKRTRKKKSAPTPPLPEPPAE